MEGWQDYQPTDRDFPGRVLVLEKAPYKVERRLIPSYFTEENAAKIAFFWQYKNLGWPYSGGWAEQPGHIVDVVMTLEQELGRRAKPEGGGQ